MDDKKAIYGRPDPFDSIRDAGFEKMLEARKHERQNRVRSLIMYLEPLEKVLGRKAVDEYAGRFEEFSLSDLEGLFRVAIHTEPDDDGLRLMYADWLEEQGNQPRAEFIRLQIEIENRLREAKRRRKGDRSEDRFNREQAAIETDPKLQALIAREDELLRDHAIDWINHDLGAGAVKVPKPTGFSTVLNSRRRANGELLKYQQNFVDLENKDAPQVFQRGMIGEVNVFPDTLIAHVDTLLPPVAERLSIMMDNVNEARAAFALPGLDSVRGLRLIMNNIGEEEERELAQVIADSPHLQHLRTLALNGATDTVLQGLASSPHLGSLESLHVHGNDLSAEAVQHFGQLNHTPSLKDAQFVRYYSRPDTGYREVPIITAANWDVFRNLPRFKDMERDDDGRLAKPAREQGRSP